MKTPEEFYQGRGTPSIQTRQQMWTAIENALNAGHSRKLFYFDRRSFLYGIAATIVLMFTSVGVYTTLQNLINSSKPETIRLDSAYERAIQQFEPFVPAVSSVSPNARNILTTRKEQLQSVDGAIVELKKEMNGTDVSPLKRARLRQLYSLKLRVIQEMIEQGEIEL